MTIYDFVENNIQTICSVLSIKAELTIVYDKYQRTGINIEHNTLVNNESEYRDLINLVRVVAHECFHLHQKCNGKKMQYSKEDRAKIESGYSYLELNYDFEVEAEAFSYLFINKLGAKINDEEDLLRIQGMNILTEKERNNYISKYRKTYKEISNKYEPIIDKLL